MTDAPLDTTPAATDAPVATDRAPPAPVEQAAPEAHADAADDLLDLDIEADGEADEPEASDAEPAADEPKAAPFLERPESLRDATPEEIAKWKAEQGMPDRESYDLPELDGGQEYSPYGKALGDEIMQLAYDLDMSPAQAQEFIVRGDPILKALAEARDTEDKRNGMRALLDEFGGNPDAVKAHVAQARSMLLRALPDGLGKAILEARGPDGKKLAYQPEFLRWASQIGAHPQAKGRTMQTDEALLAAINKVRDTDIDAYKRQNLSTEALDIMRRIDAKGQTRTAGTLTAAEAAEEAELTQMMHTDIHAYHSPYRGTGKSGSTRLLELRRKREGVAA